MKRKDNIFIASAIILFLLSIFMHAWKIDDIPPGFYWDECSTIYNSYCIAETGKDEEGKSFPLFCRAFDYYSDSLMIYSTAPIVKIFGLSKASGRCVSAFYHILAAIFLCFLSYDYARNKWIALITGFTFSIIPWVFPISRTIMGGYTPMLFWIIAGCLFILRAIGLNNWKYALAAGFSWAMVMYSYNCGRPFTAVALIVFVLAFNVLIIKRIRIFAVFIVSFLCTTIPLTIAILNNPSVIMNRLSDVSVWGDGAPFSEVAIRILARYFEYFGPSFLFIYGDPILRHGTGNSGVLFMFMIPFLLIGLFLSVMYFRTNPLYRFLLLATVVYPIAAVLTSEHYHSARTINGAPFWCLIACVGMTYAWRKRKKYTVLLIICSLFACYEISSYFNYYYTKYSVASRHDFDASTNEMLDCVFRMVDRSTETIYFSKEVLSRTADNFKPVWYVNILFYSKLSPADYLAKGRIPEDVATSYDGIIKKPGIFVRLDYMPVLDYEAGQLKWEKNTSSLPRESSLVKKIPTYSGASYEFYRVSPPKNDE